MQRTWSCFGDHNTHMGKHIDGSDGVHGWCGAGI